ncbi:FtsX-like permease family protein [Candidatus Beckwithbacteria bacterium]|nr:FtsX-like permease family protein [Candidatus Beckwithbacteria bacterium]
MINLYKLNSIYHKSINLVKDYLEAFYDLFIKSENGQLSWFLILRLAVKNLINQPSRSMVTIGATALGTATIVFLVSFGFGLQNIVTQRLVQPNSLKLIDIQSDTTALALDNQVLGEIKKLSGVANATGVISLAGSLNYKDSKMEVIVLGANNDYLDYAHVEQLTGNKFSSEAEEKISLLPLCSEQDLLKGLDKKNLCQIDLKLLVDLNHKGMVAGVATQSAVQLGDLIDKKTKRFRIDDDIYLPVRDFPENNSQILGYIRGSILQSFSGKEVWGGTYSSVNTAGYFFQDGIGQWYGKWLKTKALLYQEIAPSVYTQAKDNQDKSVEVEGYIPEVNLKILSDKENNLEQDIEKLLNKNQVLGEATQSSSVDNIYSLNIEGSLNNTDELKQILKTDQENKIASSSSQLAIVNVKKEKGKEILVSTGFINALGLSQDQIINEEVSLQYIISGGVINGITGKVLSSPVIYKIIGVIKEDNKILVYAPLADVQSMGVDKYSMIKVLVDNENNLRNVREKIETLGFITRSIVDTLNQVIRLFRIMRFLLGSLGMIALVVAVFGMFNTMTISLMERTREVAVMKTIGTTNNDVFRIFLIESGIIGFLGSLLGIILGVLMGQLITLVLHIFQGGNTVSLFYSPFSFMILIFITSSIVGLTTGIYPAKRAKAIHPLHALRYE